MMHVDSSSLTASSSQQGLSIDAINDVSIYNVSGPNFVMIGVSAITLANVDLVGTSFGSSGSIFPPFYFESSNSQAITNITAQNP